MDTNADGWKEGFPARGVPRIDTPPLPTTPPRQRQCIMIACAADMTAVEDLQNFRVYDLLRSPVTAPALRRMLHKWLPSPAQSVDRESLLDAAAAAARSPKRCKSNVLRSARVLQAHARTFDNPAISATASRRGARRGRRTAHYAAHGARRLKTVQSPALPSKPSSSSSASGSTRSPTANRPWRS